MMARQKKEQKSVLQNTADRIHVAHNVHEAAKAEYETAQENYRILATAANLAKIECDSAKRLVSAALGDLNGELEYLQRYTEETVSLLNFS